jgi:hypothetical protein
MTTSSTTTTAVAAYSPTTMAVACISVSVSVSPLFFIFLFYFSFFFNFFCLYFDSCKYFSSILMKNFGRHCASLQKKNIQQKLNGMGDIISTYMIPPMPH